MISSLQAQIYKMFGYSPPLPPLLLPYCYYQKYKPLGLYLGPVFLVSPNRKTFW